MKLKYVIPRITVLGSGAVLFLLFQNFTPNNLDQSKLACSSNKMTEILENASTNKTSVIVDCSAKLPANSKITKQLIFRGQEVSNTVFDCNGSTLDEHAANKGKDMIIVQSKKVSKNNQITWSRPSNVHIKNCHINGSVRIHGMATNGEGEELRKSSIALGHTERAQEAAPTQIKLENLKITGSSRIPVYFSPGVTYSSLINSEIKGQSASVNLYLDAESSNNLIKNNYLHATSDKREVIAVDGSANNTIVGNKLSALENGGIYLYRNCGEGGTIRHQTPSNNKIINNIFYYNKYKGANPSIWVSSRNGNRKYCNDDRGYNFGSSSNNNDLAKNNIIAQNQIYKLSTDKMIRLSESPNSVVENITVSSDLKRKSACYLKGAFPSEFLAHGESTQLFSISGQISCKEQKYTCADGVISSVKASCDKSTTSYSTVKFECQVSGNNAGCSGTARCESGKRIIGARAACNLESGKVPSSFINNVATNELSVQRASDNVRDGACVVDTKNIQQGSTSLAFTKGSTYINYSCKEYDKNGGDCHIVGQILCQ